MLLLVSGSTRTVRGLAATWPHRLGHLLTPSNRNGMAATLGTGLMWAADNGCFSGFDEKKFRRFLRKVTIMPRCLWVVCPDVVGDARGTLAAFAAWRDEVAATGQLVAFVGQDGIESLEVPWESFDCWFVGGTDDWKLTTASRDMVLEAKRRGKLAHMGRVNSRKRMRQAFDWGCDSVDGSSASMFGDKYVHKYCSWIEAMHHQPTLFAEEAT
jgi:hypothetical protein